MLKPYDAAFLVTLLFVGLRLAGVIDWHWLAVLSPIAGLLTLGVIATVIVKVMHTRAEKKAYANARDVERKVRQYL